MSKQNKKQTHESSYPLVVRVVALVCAVLIAGSILTAAFLL